MDKPLEKEELIDLIKHNIEIKSLLKGKIHNNSGMCPVCNESSFNISGKIGFCNYCKLKGDILFWHKQLNNISEDDSFEQLTTQIGYTVDGKNLKFENIKKNIYSAEALEKLDLPEPEWLVKYFIPKEAGITLFASKAGGFKTFTAIELAMSLCCGKDFLDKFSTKKSKVMYFDEENGLIRIKKRYLQIKRGKYQDDIFDNLYFSSYNDFKIDTEVGQTILKEIIKEFNPDLIILDSLVRLLQGSENEAQDANIFYSTIKEFQLPVLILHHMNKSGNGLDSVRGSSDWVNSASYVYTFNKKSHKDSFTKVSPTKLRDLSPDDIEAFEMVAEDNFDESEIEHNDGNLEKDGKLIEPIKSTRLYWRELEDESNKSNNKNDNCINEIINYLRERDLSEVETSKFELKGEILKNEEFTEYTFKKAIEKLVEKNVLTKIKKGKYAVDKCLLEVKNDF